jgi:hypothetical protein
MSTKDQIIKKIKKYENGNKMSKILGLISFTIVFGVMLFLTQLTLIIQIESESENIKIDTTYISIDKKINNEKINNLYDFTDQMNDSLSEWIYLIYNDIKNPTSLLFLMTLYSFLIPFILVFLICVPMFGSHNKIYYDNFNTIIKNSNDIIIRNKNEINSLLIFDIKDIDDNKYKIKISKDSDFFEVEKWKVSNNKIKKWIIF